MERVDVVRMAIAYIERHLDEKLDMQVIAEAVHYSRFHLHRLFTDAVGMSIHDYVLRRKLTEAAKLLVLSDLPILDISFFAGYESQQSFTDAFGAMYKITPCQFRKNEVFYPLQLAFDFGSCIPEASNVLNEICYACESDIPLWMELVSLTVDGFPCLSDEEHIGVLAQRIKENSAFMLKAGSFPVAAMMISRNAGSIDFLCVHPLFQGQGIIKRMVNRALYELNDHRIISTTTFREGDRADTGHRKKLQSIGFAEAELMMEFGYPTQKMIIPGEKCNA